MNVTILYAHPYEGSFTNSVKKALLEGLEDGQHTVDFIDLHQDDFNPVLTLEELAVYGQGKALDPNVIRYQQSLEKADVVIFLFPIWWGIMPAILKGFLDKVFLPNWAYTVKDGKTIGKLGHLKPVVIYTQNTSCLHNILAYGNPIRALLQRTTFGFTGMQQPRWFVFSRVRHVSAQQRQRWINRIETFGRTLK